MSKYYHVLSLGFLISLKDQPEGQSVLAGIPGQIQKSRIQDKASSRNTAQSHTTQLALRMLGIVLH